MKNTCSLIFVLLTFLYKVTDCSAAITIPPLPYEMDALEPYITKRTLEFHYGKHHLDYGKKLNEMLDKPKHKSMSDGTLEGIIMATPRDPDHAKLFNMAAQVWNHTFYWNSMKKGGGGEPTGPLLDKIKNDFGSYAVFKKEFIDVGTKLFGSGWVWLVLDGDHLKIVGTPNAELPLTQGQIPLLTCDIWEHAYYLDYQNRRQDYVTVFLEHLVNWEFAEKNLVKGKVS